MKLASIYAQLKKHEMRTYHVCTHADVQDHGAGGHPLALAQEVEGDGYLQHAPRQPYDGRRDHVPEEVCDRAPSEMDRRSVG
jgi:hypothetical protein